MDQIWEIIKFRGLDYNWLARRCDYSVQYIRDVASGRKRVTAEFRKRASFALDLPEHMLFDSESLSEASEPSDCSSVA